MRYPQQVVWSVSDHHKCIKSYTPNLLWLRSKAGTSERKATARCPFLRHASSSRIVRGPHALWSLTDHMTVRPCACASCSVPQIRGQVGQCLDSGHRPGGLPGRRGSLSPSLWMKIGQSGLPRLHARCANLSQCLDDTPPLHDTFARCSVSEKCRRSSDGA